MSGADKLKDRILTEAKSQAEAVLEDAKQRAAAIVAKGKAEAAAKETAVLEEAERQAQERKRRAQTIAELDARKALLAAKEQCIENTFEQAITRLQNVEPAVYEEMMYNMLLAATQTGGEEIIVSAADRSRFNKELLARVNSALVSKGKQGKLTLSDETRDIRGGFILNAGDVEINNSFNSLLRMQRDHLEPEIAAILFN